MYRDARYPNAKSCNTKKGGVQVRRLTLNFAEMLRANFAGG